MTDNIMTLIDELRKTELREGFDFCQKAAEFQFYLYLNHFKLTA